MNCFSDFEDGENENSFSIVICRLAGCVMEVKDDKHK